MVQVSQSETQTGSCKDILHGFLSGQLSSALGDYQVGALRKEFQQFTNNMEQSMNEFKKKMKADFERRGITINLSLKDFEPFPSFYNLNSSNYCSYNVTLWWKFTQL
jgi:uncharacterized protein YgfB (UPF0149 family)